MDFSVKKSQSYHGTTKEKWWVLSWKEVQAKLAIMENGLTSEEVQERQRVYGFNELPIRQKDGAKEMFWRQIKSALIYVLMAASFISFILGDIVDAIIILAVVVINVSIGFFQEFKTARALLTLKRAVVSFAKVRRDGQEKLIPAEELVPGDLMIIYAGDKISADVRLFKTQQLKINEAILTGEAEVKEKHVNVLAAKTILAERDNMCFMGTWVMAGSGEGVVVETGVKTEVGQIAELMSTTKESATPLQQKINRFANFLTKTIVFVCVFIFLIGLILKHNFVEMLTTAVAVAVAAIPEGLAITVTVVLAIGMQRILKKGAIVKNLLATETLGSTQVIAVDKTGTLTTGEMRVEKIVTADTEFQWETGVPELTSESAAEQIFVIRIGVLCNNAYVAQQLNSDQVELLGDSTERALFLAGESFGLARDLLEKQYPRIDEIPFNSKDKFMMTLNKFDEQHNIIYLKGAPEKVLLFCNYIYSHHIKEHLELNSYRREKIVNAIEEMSGAGLRVVAVGYKKVSAQVKTISYNINLADVNPEQWERLNMRDLYTNFVLVGLIGIIDPIRESVKEAVFLAKKAGIKTIMITGDHKLTAKTVAEKIGFQVGGGHVIDGEELDKLSDTDLLDKIEKIQVYARVTPADKMRIIKAWQNKQSVIAMTGDGINDAPALKQANIGLVVNNGNDVVKEAADMILIKNDFGTIVEAVKQGRIIFENIKKIILYFLSDSLVEMMVIIFSLFMGWPLPILATQIIWVNLIDDSFLGMSLTNDPVDFEVMDRPPQKITEEVLNKKRKKIILITSVTLSAIILFSFWIFWQNNLENLKLARTIAFALLGFDSIFCVLGLRNLHRPVWQTRPWQSPWLIGAMVVGLMLQIWAVENSFWQNILATQGLNWQQWLYVLILSLMTVVIIEAVKRFFYPTKKKKISK